MTRGVLPAVVGMSAEDARARIGEAGFTNVLVELVTHDEVEAGDVVKQTPAAGAEPGTSAQIILQVSDSPGQRVQLTVPDDLAGRPAEEVIAILRQLDFAVVQHLEQSDAIPEGFVVRTEPGPGVLLEEGDTVTVVVSAGPN